MGTQQAQNIPTTCPADSEEHQTLAAEQQDAPLIRLVPIQGSTGARVTDVLDLPFEIGRGDECNLRIGNHASVSRLHCKFVIEQASQPDVDHGNYPHTIFVEDLSTYGTFINGVRMTSSTTARPRMILCDKDIVSLGSHTGYMRWRDVSWEVLFPAGLGHKWDLSERVGSYILKGVLGEGQGGSATVRIGVKSTTGEHFAVKVMLSNGVEAGMLKKHRHFAEMKLLSHPNLTRMVDMFEEKDRVYVVMELASGGDLFTYFSEKRKELRQRGLTEDDSRAVLSDVLSGLSYLHDNHILHRDVKTENILLQYDERGRKYWQLSDFGFIRLLKAGEDRVTTWCGTEQYMSPELITGQPYTAKADMWSVGCVLYSLLSGCFAFDGEAQLLRVLKDRNPQKCLTGLLFEGARLTLWKNTSKEAIDFLKNLLQVYPKSRMTAGEALSHPFVLGKRGKKRRAYDVDEIETSDCEECSIREHGASAPPLGLADVSDNSY